MLLLSHINSNIIHLFSTSYFLFLHSYFPNSKKNKKKNKKLFFFLLVHIYYFTFFNFSLSSLSPHYSLFYCYTLSFSLSYILTLLLFRYYFLYSIHIFPTKNYEYLLFGCFLFKYVFWYCVFFFFLNKKFPITKSSLSLSKLWLNFDFG